MTLRSTRPHRTQRYGTELKKTVYLLFFLIISSAIVSDVAYSLELDVGSIDFDTVEPGTISIHKFNATNLGSESIMVGFEIVSLGEIGYKFIAVDPSEVLIPAGSSIEVTVRLFVPQDLKPRKYSASLFCAEVTSDEDGAPGVVEFSTTVGKEVYLSFYIEGYRVEVYTEDTELGEPVAVWVYFENYTPLDVVAEPLVLLNTSGKAVRSFIPEAVNVSRDGGVTFWTLEEVYDLPEGPYIVDARVTASGQIVVGEGFFLRGVRRGEAVDAGKGLTLSRERLGVGGVVAFTVLRNTGTLPLNVTFTIYCIDSGQVVFTRTVEKVIVEGEERLELLVPEGTLTPGVGVFPKNIEELLVLVRGYKVVTLEAEVGYGYESVVKSEDVTTNVPVITRVSFFGLIACLVCVPIAVLMTIRRRRSSG